jgi:hypothetical protein
MFPEKIYFVDHGEDLLKFLHDFDFHTTTSESDIEYILAKKVKDMVDCWIKHLEEAVVCDPDEGDPICCLEEVEHVIKLMKNRKELK